MIIRESHNEQYRISFRNPSYRLDSRSKSSNHVKIQRCETRARSFQRDSDSESRMYVDSFHPNIIELTLLNNV